MKPTELLYLDNPTLYATLSEIVETGKDDKGYYVSLYKTIHYPGGGGQPQDISTISQNGFEVRVTATKMIDGLVRHYLDINSLDGIDTQKDVAIKIDSHSRRLFSAYHTAGHWLAGMVQENIGLPWIPLKAHHYPNEAYIEFEGQLDENIEELTNHLYMCMAIDRQAQPKVSWRIISKEDTATLAKCNLPANFSPNLDKPLRLVAIDLYSPVPCGGIHVSQLADIKSVKIESICLKNRKIRVRYSVEIWPLSAS